MLTGGYYEPVLAALPDADKQGQIAKMSEAVLKDFGVEPIGMWLAERVWEPHLPKVLHEAGLRYTILDDTHFKYGGYVDDDLFGHYVTEEQGHPINLFSSLQYLRFNTPWGTVGDIIEWLRQQAAGPVKAGAPPRVAVMGDDGEKFGLWPTTYDHCWTGRLGGRVLHGAGTKRRLADHLPAGRCVEAGAAARARVSARCVV